MHELGRRWPNRHDALGWRATSKGRRRGGGGRATESRWERESEWAEWEERKKKKVNQKRDKPRHRSRHNWNIPHADGRSSAGPRVESPSTVTTAAAATTTTTTAVAARHGSACVCFFPVVEHPPLSLWRRRRLRRRLRWRWRGWCAGCTATPRPSTGRGRFACGRSFYPAKRVRRTVTGVSARARGGDFDWPYCGGGGGGDGGGSVGDDGGGGGARARCTPLYTRYYYGTTAARCSILPPRRAPGGGLRPTRRLKNAPRPVELRRGKKSPRPKDGPGARPVVFRRHRRARRRSQGRIYTPYAGVFR